MGRPVTDQATRPGGAARPKGAARDGWAAVLFDLDGTLADTVDLIVRCFRHTMSVHHAVAPPEEAWLRTIGRPLRDQLRIFTDDEDEVEAMARTYSTYQKSIHDDWVRPFPAARETVEALREQGVAVAVVTSKRRQMTGRTLRVCGLDGLFQTLVCADDVARGKPHPEPVHRALRELGLVGREGEVLFVGDAPYDIQAGRAAGVRTAAVTWSTYPRETLEEAGPDLWIGGLPELVEQS